MAIPVLHAQPAGALIDSLRADSVSVELLAMEGRFRFFETDRLGQLYLVTERDELIKYTAEGQEQFRYHNTTLGQLASLDVADPFSPALFYPDQQLVILLDRTLGDRGLLDLRETDIQNATALARSHDNNLWVYDDYAGQLIKMSPRGEVLLTSDDLRLTENLTSPAAAILRWGDRVLVHFPERGLAVFSVFGRLERWWPLSDLSHLRIRQDRPHFMQDGQYCLFEPANNRTFCLQPDGGTKLLQYDQRGNLRYFLSEQRMRMLALRVD